MSIITFFHYLEPAIEVTAILLLLGCLKHVKESRWILLSFLLLFLTGTATRNVLFCNTAFQSIVVGLDGLLLIRFLRSIKDLRWLALGLNIILISSVIYVFLNQFVVETVDCSSLDIYIPLFDQVTEPEFRLILAVRNLLVFIFSIVIVLKLVTSDKLFDELKYSFAYLFAMIWLTAGSFFITAFTFLIEEKSVAAWYWRIFYLSVFMIYVILMTSTTLWKKYKLKHSS